jgi:hypothetical protein
VILAGLVGASPASAAGTLAVSWSPTTPTASTPVTVAATITGCGNGNVSAPEVLDLITGPHGYDNNSYLGSTLSNGGDTATATASLGDLPAGSYSIQFYGRGPPCYSSNTAFTWSTPVMMTVSPTTTSLSSSGSPSTVGASVIYTATVSPLPDGGAVAFTDNATTIIGCSAVAVNTSTGVATCTPATAYAAVGSHSIVATYSGNSDYAGSAAMTLTQTVDQATPTTMLGSSLNPSAVGAPVTYAAALPPGATGTVAFMDAGTMISGCGAQAVNAATGVATCLSPSYAAVTTHVISAVYSGDSTYSTSTSTALTQTVNKAPADPVIGSVANPSSVGQSVSYSVVGLATDATGTLTFTDAGTTITGCGSIAVSAGGGTCPAGIYSTAGSHAITAVYSGDGNYLGATSSTLTQTVDQAPTTTTLGSSANPSTVGGSLTYTATVPAAATGTVAFTDAGSPITGCVAQTVSAGSATCVIASGYLAATTHPMTAVYSGDTNYTGSTSATLTETVDSDPAPPTQPITLSTSTQTTSGATDVVISLSGPGAVSARPYGSRAVQMISSLSVRAAGQRTMILQITPSPAAKRLLKRRQTVNVTLAITFTPRDGQPTTRLVTVKLRHATPSHTFSVSHIKVRLDGTVRFQVNLPGPGQIDVMESAWKSNIARIASNMLLTKIATVRLGPATGRFIFARTHLNPKTDATLQITVKPNGRGQLLVSHHQGGALRIRLWVTYQPTSGRPQTVGYYGLLVTPYRPASGGPADHFAERRNLHGGNARD